MQKINFLTNSRFQRPFPKPRERLLSFYKHKEAKIRIKKAKLVDGTLFPSDSSCKGCNRLCKECSAIPVEKLSTRLKQKILYRLGNPSKIKLGQEMRIFVTCPSDKFPKDEKKPKIEVLSFCLEAKGTNSCKASDNIAKVLGIEDNINELGLSLKIVHSSINLVKLEGRKQTYFIRCPRFPLIRNSIENFSFPHLFQVTFTHPLAFRKRNSTP